MSQLRSQLDLDVERLRKASDRLEIALSVMRALQHDRTVAIQALKIIATWAKRLREDQCDTDANQIHERALDTLRLMGEKVCE